MQTVSLGDNLHEISNQISGKNKKNISKCCLLKSLPSMLSIICFGHFFFFLCVGPRQHCLPLVKYFLYISTSSKIDLFKFMDEYGRIVKQLADDSHKIQSLIFSEEKIIKKIKIVVCYNFA